MQLEDLEKYDSITIQCHDNPDADALASGYGLYCYFKSKKKKVRMVYSGEFQISKSNLKLMVSELHLPIEYIPVESDECTHVEGLLITVDCQYGAGNVTGLTADEIVVIDHHQQEREVSGAYAINTNLGSCSTLVWKLLTDADYMVTDKDGLGTALYYGLYTDTNQFSELYNPLDMDMREALPFDKSKITLFRNSNLSLKELETAGIAMLRYSFNEDLEFAIIQTKTCDSNILGLISDFLLQVDVIKTCVVYNRLNDGYKYSVRSCIKEVNASELAAYLADGMGSGGGHYEKAGGFINQKLYQSRYPTLHAEGYFHNRMVEYFNSFDIIHAEDYPVNIEKMDLYERKKLPQGYVKMNELLPNGTPITIRTLEGDIERTVEEDLYVVIGTKGEVYPYRELDFVWEYTAKNKSFSEAGITMQTEYDPIIKDRSNGESLVLTDYAKICIPNSVVRVYAKPLERGVKIFTLWEKQKYMLGRPGDYLAVYENGPRNIFVIGKDDFSVSYEKVERK